MTSSWHDIHWADYTVVAFSIALSISTGIFHAIKARWFRKSDSSQKDDYLMGGRKMAKVPVALSLLTSFLSGILMLGVPAEMYQRGAQIWLNFLMGIPAFILTAVVFLPVFYKMQTTCVHEYFIHRYDSLLIRRLFSVLFILFTLCYMSVVIYAPSVALSEVLQIRKSILIVIIGLSTTLYTCIGGLKAVVWADSLQAFMMYGGIFSVITAGLANERTGGLSRVVSLAFDSGRISELLRTDLRVDQYNSLWINLFSGTITWVASFSVNQIAIQRYSSLPSLKAAQTIIYCTVLPFFVLCSLVAFVGFVALAYFFNCDPVETGQIRDIDHMIILFARDILNDFPGLFGLYVSCIIAATLSTLSSGLNSLAAALYEDFLKQKYEGRVSDGQATLLNKALTILCGILATVMAFAAEPLGGILRVCISVMGALSGPMVGIFVLPLFFPRSGRLSCLVSFISSTVVMVIICVANYTYDPYRELFLKTNTSAQGCAGITTNNITLRVPPFYDVHYGDPTAPYTSRISTYAYAAVGFVLMLSIGVPLTFLEKENPRVHPLTFYGRHESWPPGHSLLSASRPPLKKKTSFSSSAKRASHSHNKKDNSAKHLLNVYSTP